MPDFSSRIVVRCLIGLIQGVILAALYNSLSTEWGSTRPFLIIPLCMVMVFVPLLIVQSLGYLRTKTLFIWILTGTIALFGMAYYAVYRQSLPTQYFVDFLPVLLSCGIPVFIAHALILSGEQDRHFIAHYPTYFDIAWKLGVQTVLAVLFTIIFWLLFYLGIGLFEIIHLSFFYNIVTNSWFGFPASAVAIAFALHITDVKVSLIRGIRSLGLLLLSWLLPIITAIVTVFLISLFSTGLFLLWKTGFASWLLLIAAASLIILINAVYQDGKHALPIIQRLSATLACCLLIPLVFLALYALQLRVAQYGWSVPRIEAFVFMLIAGAYAIGYTIAVFTSISPLKFIETTNFSIACLIITLAIALQTPLADPARLMVANQLSRLQRGEVSPEKFDFKALLTQGRRFGHAALDNLAAHSQGSKADYIKAQIKAILEVKKNNEWNPNQKTRNPPSIVLYTKNTKIPDSFLKQNWEWKDRSIALPSCLYGMETCYAWIFLDKDKASIVVLLNNPGFNFMGFKQNIQGIWTAIGTWTVPFACMGIMQSAMQGNFKVVVPTKPDLPDIEIKGWRTTFKPSESSNPCQ